MQIMLCGQLVGDSANYALWAVSRGQYKFCSGVQFVGDSANSALWAVRRGQCKF